MATEKIVNYTAEQTAAIVSAYVDEGQSSEQIAKTTGRTVRSIVAKLVREKVYVSKEKAKAEKRASKADLVARIAELTGAAEEKLDSLEKATREALEVLVDALE